MIFHHPFTPKRPLEEQLVSVVLRLGLMWQTSWAAGKVRSCEVPESFLGLMVSAPVLHLCCLQGYMDGSSSGRRNGGTVCTCCGMGTFLISLPTVGIGESLEETTTPGVFTHLSLPTLLLPPAWCLPSHTAWLSLQARTEEWGRWQRWLQTALLVHCVLLFPSSWQQNANQINGLIALLLVTKLILLSALNKC